MYSLLLAVLVLVAPQRPVRPIGIRSSADVQQLINRLGVLNKLTVDQAVSGLAGIGPRAVPFLVHTLKSKDTNKQVRVGVMRALTEMGPASAPALPVLLPYLDDKRPEIRGNALAAIGAGGDAARPHLGRIRKMWKDEHSSVRRLAMYVTALLSTPEERQPLLAELRKPLDEDVSTVQLYVVRTLTELYGPKALPLFDSVFALLAQPPGPLVDLAKNALVAMGPGAVPKILAEYEKADAAHRPVLVKLLERFRPPSKRQLDVVVAAMHSKDSNLRGAAATALRMLGAPGLDALLEQLDSRDTDKDLVLVAMGELKAIGNPARKGAARLIALCRDPDVAVRTAALQVFAGMNVGVPEVLPVLKHALSDDAESVRLAATAAMGAMGPLAVPVLPKLVDLMCTDTGRVAARMQGVLRRLGGHAVPAAKLLVERLQSKSLRERGRAADGLEILGAFAVPELLKRLESAPPVATRLMILRTLQVIGKPASAAVPTILRLLADDSAEVRRDATLALMRFGDAAKPGYPQWVRMLDSTSVDLRLAAVMAIGRVCHDQDGAFDKLIERLDDGDPTVRYAAYEALGWRGNKAAVPRLIKALDSHDEFVRMRAATALGKIGPDAGDALRKLDSMLSFDRSKHVHAAVNTAIESIRGK